MTLIFETFSLVKYSFFRRTLNLFGFQKFLIFVAGTSSFHAWLVVSYEWQRQTTCYCYFNLKMGISNRCAPVWELYKINHENIHFRFRTPTMQMCLLFAPNFWIIFYWNQGVNTKNVMYLNIIYVLMLHCMIKLRPDLESAYQDEHFDI